MKRIWLLGIVLSALLLAGCVGKSASASLGASGGENPSAADSAGETDGNEEDFHPIHPALNEGVPGEIDFGDPAARTEIAGGLFPGDRRGGPPLLHRRGDPDLRRFF